LRKKLHSHFVQQRGAQYHVICYLPKQPEDGSQNESWRTLGFNLPLGVRLGSLFGNLLTRLPKDQWKWLMMTHGAAYASLYILETFRVKPMRKELTENWLDEGLKR
jgi:hypothetical protein